MGSQPTRAAPRRFDPGRLALLFVLGVITCKGTASDPQIDGGIDSTLPDDAANPKLDSRPDAFTSKKDAPVPIPDAPPPAANTFRFSVYGDTRTQHQVHARVLEAMATFKPRAVFHTGDMEVDYNTGTLTTWLNLVNAHAVFTDLIEKRLYLVARGNHDGPVYNDARWPTLSRQVGDKGTSERFSLTMDRAFVVFMGLDPADTTSFLDAELSKPEAKNAAWRFVVAHYPIYDSGQVHRTNGVPSVERLCDKYGVDAFFSGHEHLHERSFQMKGGQVVDRGDDMKAGAGTLYIVEGGGGAPIYYVVDGPLPSSRFTKSAHGFQVVDMDDTSLSFTSYDQDAKMLDHFAVRK